MPKEEMFTPAEAAEFIGCKVSTLYDWRYKRIITKPRRYPKTYVEIVKQLWENNQLYASKSSAK